MSRGHHPRTTFGTVNMNSGSGRLRTLGVTAIVALVVAACGGAADDDGAADGGPAGSGVDTDVEVHMTRATWDTGWFQAATYRLLLEELGYGVTDPAEDTREPVTFYPALARGEVDLWANGWFPLHEPFLEGTLVTGQSIAEPIEPVGTQVPAGAIQGYLIDKATADEHSITSMSGLTDPDIAGLFDHDGDGMADLYGCNDGWGCNVEIESQLEELDWGGSVEQIVGDYNELMGDVEQHVADGEPVLFYTWTPNWTVGVLPPGEDVVWLESPTPDDVEGSTEVEGLEGCAGDDPCELGWLVNDIQAVSNADFLDDNPPIRTLLEQVRIPLDDIAEQNRRMNEAEEYSEADILADAEAWIEDNRDLVDGWLDAARGS